LTRRAANQNIDLITNNAGCFAYIIASQLRDIARKSMTFWKVLLVSSSMNLVLFNGGNNVETSLLETKRHSPSTTEQINRS
jgi:hypothetical protein